jgi:hypothetical protein
MGAQIIHHHHISGAQRWTQHALHIRPEDLRVGCTVHRHDGLEALDAQGPQYGDIRPAVLGHAPDDPRSPGGTAIQSRHGEIDARFIHELQSPYLQPGAQVAVVRPRLLDARRVALCGMK